MDRSWNWPIVQLFVSIDLFINQSISQDISRPPPPLPNLFPVPSSAPPPMLPSMDTPPPGVLPRAPIQTQHSNIRRCLFNEGPKWWLIYEILHRGTGRRIIPKYSLFVIDLFPEMLTSLRKSSFDYFSQSIHINSSHSHSHLSLWCTYITTFSAICHSFNPSFPICVQKIKTIFS